MHRSFAAIAALLIVGLLISSGCSPSPPAAPATNQPAAPSPAAKLEREYWNSLFIQGHRVGYSHTTVRREVEAGSDVLQTDGFARMTLRRGNDQARQDLRITAVETPAGRLLHAECEMAMSDHPIRTVGRVVGDRLELEMTGQAAAPVRTALPWSSGCGGPFAMEQSLLRKPMQPGERRTLKMLRIELGQIVDAQMDAKEFESTSLQSGNRKLLRIESVVHLAGGQKEEETLWTDDAGDVLKTLSPVAGGFETQQVSKAEALKEIEAGGLDLQPSMIVKIKRPLPSAHRTTQVRYRVHLDGGDPAKVFAVGPSQAVKPLDAHTAEITVYAIRPGATDGNRDAASDPPTEGDRRPNLWVQSDDPLIVADARKAVGDETDAWRKAVAIEKFVNRDITTKNFVHVFDSAAEVARTHEGDCTEHAVFLMALARAQGIPARAAVGLVYVPSEQAFGYHLWAEVYVAGRWIPVDGTLALGGIGAGHLKVTDTDLKTTSAQSTAFLPVAQILGQLSIEVIDAK